MTEARWRRSNDTTRLLELIKGKASERKLRLFGCACCRQVEDVFPDAKCRAALTVAERFADRLANEKELEAAHQPVDRARDLATGTYHTFDEYKSRFVRAATFALHALTADLGRQKSDFFGDLYGSDIVWNVVKEACEDAQYARLRPRKNRKAQAAILRDIFGNPFRPVTLAPAHKTPTVHALAQAAYDERSLPSGELDPQRLGVLADALEEAGAPSDLVAHLRSPGPHVRGCFAVDLVLGLT